MRDLMQKFEQGELSETEEDQVFHLLAQKHEKNKLKAIRAEQTPMRVVHRKPMLTMLKAASVLLIVGVGFWFFQSNSTPQYLKLTENYLETVPAYSDTKLSVPGMSIEENEAQAKTAYNKGSYTQAVTFLSNIIATGKATPEHHFFLAISFLHQSPPNNESAITHLLMVRQLSPNERKLEVGFQLALAYIRTKQFEPARTELRAIDGKYKTAEVRQLLSEIPQQ